MFEDLKLVTIVVSGQPLWLLLMVPAAVLFVRAHRPRWLGLLAVPWLFTFFAMEIIICKNLGHPWFTWKEVLLAPWYVIIPATGVTGSCLMMIGYLTGMAVILARQGALRALRQKLKRWGDAFGQAVARSFAVSRTCAKERRESRRALRDAGYRRGSIPVQVAVADGTMRTVFVKVGGGRSIGGTLHATYWFMKVGGVAAVIGWGVTNFNGWVSGIGHWAEDKAASIVQETVNKQVNRFLKW